MYETRYTRTAVAVARNEGRTVDVSWVVDDEARC